MEASIVTKHSAASCFVSPTSILEPKSCAQGTPRSFFLFLIYYTIAHQLFGKMPKLKYVYFFSLKNELLMESWMLGCRRWRLLMPFLMLVGCMILVKIDMTTIRRVLLRFLDMGLILNLVVLVLYTRCNHHLDKLI